MNILSRLLRRRHGPQGQRRIDNRLEEILETEARRLQSVDPETAQQWLSLQMVLEDERRPVPAAPPTERIRSLWPAISLAVVVTVLIAVGVIRRSQSATTTYETGKGELSTIILSDSSEVSLNNTSQLVVYRLADQGGRHVSLNGEAFFKVRKNGAPFIVSTKVATVQVLGTEFNVRVREGSLEVAVMSGKVQVSAQKGGRDSSVVLVAGQIAVCAAGDYPAPPNELLFAEYPGWMHGRFLFYRTSMASVCREIESKFNVTVRIGDPALRDETVTGSVDARSLEVALSTLVSLTGKNYRYENNGYTLY